MHSESNQGISGAFHATGDPYFIMSVSVERAARQVQIWYFSCSCRRSSNCRARAYIPQDGSDNELVLTKEHSHPPDYMLEKKAEIWKILKQFAMTLPGKPLQVYNSVVSVYPEAEELFPFKSVETSIKRFRKRLKNRII